MLDATLRLFKAVQIKNLEAQAPKPNVLAATIPFGYVLDRRIKPSSKVLRTINDQIGIDGEQANATFHKSWEKIRSADIRQLVLEQMIHYMTTYDYSRMGIYDPSTVCLLYTSPSPRD